jgi:tetratricopeptide (TPR) repeat protein
MRYLDTSLRNIQKNRKYNEGLFQPGYEVADKMGVYHYKCILYSYDFNIDSAEKYYGLMRSNNGLPHNNYANFKSVCGNFREAEKEYQIASGIESGDKRLQEWAYYTSILHIGKGKTKDAVQLSDEMIKGFGSSPGFGWYNIALSRALTYDGQIAAAQKAVEKAAEFKEVHIGTTLGQSHYDFSIQLLKLIQKEQQIAMQKFEHRDWWYTPKVLGNMAQMTTERFMQQYLIINQFAQNPERDRVVYKLFSTESTVSWDEVWYLIKDFSSAFFVKRFERELKENKRKPINKYFKLFLARLKTKQGNYQDAKTLLNDIIQDPTMDEEYERLFIARCFQALAECADKEKDIVAKDKWTYQMFKTYPQLVPFAGLKVNLNLKVSGSDQAVMKAFRNCNFTFDKAKADAPTAQITFLKKGTKQLIRYSLVDKKGRAIVPEQSFVYRNAEKAGIELAYRICGVGGNEPKDKK